MSTSSVQSGPETSAPPEAGRRPPEAGRVAARCVLDLWATGIGRNEACAAALGRLLLARPELVSELADLPTAVALVRQRLEDELAVGGAAPSTALLFVATAELLEAAGRRDEAVALCRESLPALVAACGADPAALDLMERFLDEAGGADGPSARLLLRLRASCLMAGGDSDAYLELRGLGLDAFVAGWVEEAEDVYRYLVARDFEPAGSRCHWARVLLLKGRDAEALAAVEEARGLRDGEPQYILGRILVLRALLAALAGEEVEGHLRAIREVVADPAMRMEWTMAPVLAHVGARLGTERHKLFAALVAAVSDARGLARLAVLPGWDSVARAPGGAGGGKTHA